MNRNAYLRKFRAFVQKNVVKCRIFVRKSVPLQQKFVQKCDYGKKRHQTAPCMEAKEKS